nr:hypothetical protein [uncultured Acetobacter sp.]
MTDVSSPYVIRAARFEALTDARQIRAQARADAAACLEEARRQAAAVRHAAQVDAQRLLMETRIQAQGEVSSYLKSFENSIADLSFLVARRLIDDLPRDERLIRLVRTALAELPAQMGMTVKVPVSEGSSLRAALQQEGAPLDALTVMECASVEAGDCVLQHEQGQTRLDVSAQLRALWQGAAA